MFADDGAGEGHLDVERRKKRHLGSIMIRIFIA